MKTLNSGSIVKGELNELNARENKKKEEMKVFLFILKEIRVHFNIEHGWFLGIITRGQPYSDLKIALPI